MTIAKKINRWLARIDLVVSRRSRFEHLEDIRRELLRHQIHAKWSLADMFDRNSGPNLIGNRRSCPLCGHESLASEFSAHITQCSFGGGILVRHQCPACDVIFGADKIFRLSESELSEEYEWHYRAYSEGDSTQHEIRAFLSLNPSKDGIYLNYGAGAWSRSVQILRAQGWNIVAFEPHGSASSDGEVISDWKILSTMKFDGLYSNNVLEHLRHPAEELARMKTLLKPGALMSHATPCFEYLYEYTRFHLFFFLGRSREILAHKAGLMICDFIMDGEFMNCVYQSSDD